MHLVSNSISLFDLKKNANLLLLLLSGYVAENNSFYASLRPGPIPQDQELMLSDGLFSNNSTEWRELEANRYLINGISFN